MGVNVRQAKHGKWGLAERNWVVVDDYHVTHLSGARDMSGRLVTWVEHVIRTYTCTTWADAISVADDLANGRRIDVATVVALSERRV